MKIFKHRIFNQWAKSEDITDGLLKQAVEEMEKGVYEANLGSGLYKKRVARKGAGKRGGYRVLLAFKDHEKAFFVYGYAKKARDNIDDQELKVYRQLAKDLLSINANQIQEMINNSKLFEVK